MITTSDEGPIESYLKKGNHHAVGGFMSFQLIGKVSSVTLI